MKSPRAVASENINISGGKFETSEEEILIRAYSREYFAKDLERLVIRGNPDGTTILLKDVATIREQWEDVPDKTYYNGRNAVVLTIDQTEQEDILAIAEKTHEMVADFNDENTHVSALVLDDRTVPLRQRLDLLIRNGMIGLLLVVISP